MARVPPLAVLAALLALACGDSAAWLERAGVHALAEVGPAEAAREAATGRARLVQRSAPDERLPRLPHAVRLGDDEPPPASWLEGGPRVLAIASRREDALRLAARLRRAGVPRVGIVRGDVGSLGETGRAHAAAQPDAARHHPSTRPGTAAVRPGGSRTRADGAP